MLAFEFLELENFMCFQSPVKIPLRDQGLVVIKGDNQVSNVSDANGVGKTVVAADGLAWVLYGQTLRGLKADAVINRFSGKKTCKGKLTFESDGELWRIVRERPHRIYVVNGSNEEWTGPEAEEVIQRKIGIGFKTYCNAVVFGQGAFERFAKADQATKLRMFDEIQGVDFRKMREAAVALRSKIEAEQSIVESKLQSLRSTGVDLADEKEQLERERDDFKAAQKKRLAARRKAEEEALDEYLRAKEAFEEFKAEQAKLPELQRKKAKLEKAAEILDEMRDELNSAESEKRVIDTIIANELKSLEKLVAEGVCPTCRREVLDRGDVNVVTEAFEREVAPSIEAQKEAEKTITRCVKALNKAQARYDKAVADSGGVTSIEIARLEAKYDDDAEDIRRKRLKTLKAAAEKARDEYQNTVTTDTWGGEQALARLVEKQLKVGKELKKRVKENDKLQLKYDMADYWVVAFGDRGIRSRFLMSQADFLNARLLQHLETLAGSEAEVLLSPERTTGKGATKQQFNIQTKWNWGGETYESESGGQERRVDLAIFLALQDLAEKTSASPFPLRMWDQPEEGLDATGLEMFGRWMKVEARRRGTGFLITHNPILAEAVQADQEWTVQLTEDGSRLVL